MPASQIQFTGINRRVSDYAQTGACEELINLRPTEAGLIPTRAHKTLFEGTDYLNAWTHNVGTDSLLIVSRIVNDDLVFYRLLDNGTTIEICRFGAYDDVAVAMLANMLVFSDKTSKENKLFRWEGSSYNALEYNLTMPEAEVSFGSLEAFYSKMPRWQDDMELADVLQPGFDAVQNQHKGHCFGNVLVALNFKCKDGTEFWTSQWLMPNLIPVLETEGPNVICNPGITLNAPYVKTIDGQPYALTYIRFSGQENAYIYLAGAPLNVTLRQITEYDRETSMIEAVNIYASKPKVCLDVTSVESETAVQSTVYLHRCLLKQPEDLQKELLYFQKTVYMADLVKGDVETKLEFGGDIQTTSRTLDVDAGAVMRYGDMLSYNNRIHFYDSTARLFATRPYADGGLVQMTADVYGVYTISTGEEKVLHLGTYTMPWGTGCRFICPDSRVTRLILRTQEGIVAVDMQASPRYNYSYNFDADVTVPEDPADLYALVDTAEEGSFTYEEPQDMNVSEQMNPFVFDVSHSYRFPGRILEVQVQLAEASDVAFGTYPLEVMTDKGVYTLAQGSGNVLYGNIVKVNDLVATGGSASTKQGVFVLAAGGLWLVAGRFTTLVSEALNGGPHKYLRSNPDYQALTGTGSALYDISPYVSDPEFRDYVMGATLSFDQWEDDLIVSNRAYAYSYVLSLKHRQWFKITERISQSSVGDKRGLREISSSGGTTAEETFSLYSLLPSTVKHFAKLDYYDTYENDFNYSISITGDGTSATGTASFDGEMYDRRSFLTALLAAAGITADMYVTTNDDYLYALNDNYAGATITITKVGAGTTIANGAFAPISYPGAPGIPFGAGTYSITCGTAAANMTLSAGTTKRENMATLVNLINSSNFPVTAVFIENEYAEQYDRLQLTAKTPGAAGNNLTLSLRKQGGNVVKFGPLEGGTDPLIIHDIIDFSDVQLEYETIEGETVPTGRLAPVTVHLESRPMAPGQYMYTHVYRIVQLVRAHLEGDDNLTVALYGSEDLQGWKLLTNAQRKDTTLSQIRTGMAPKSWRYFKITVGGIVAPETDFGPVLMDFHTGRRRIG